MNSNINFTSKKIEYYVSDDSLDRLSKINVNSYATNITNMDAVEGDYFQKGRVSSTISGDYTKDCRQAILEKVLGDLYKTGPLQIPRYAQSVNETLKPKVSDEVAINSAKKITNDKDLQKVLVEFAQKEAVIVRTKADATPIMREQFSRLNDKNNVIVLDINPQLNNGMQKSNTLMSNWYVEANNISRENLVTLRQDELRTKMFKPIDFHPDWKQSTDVAKTIEKSANKVKMMSMEEAREILDDIKGLSSKEIRDKYTLKQLASVMKTINTNIIFPQKKMGYVGALVAQLEEASKDKNEITLVIPDDCSLSGSSMLCDSVKILDKFIQNNPEKKVNVVYSPLILGDMAQTAFDNFMDKDFAIDDAYLHQVSALKIDDTEAYPGIRSAFKNVKNSKNITFEVAPNHLKAKHFTETEYFKNIQDPIVKSKLLYLLQGPRVNGYPMFGGYGGCGVMVITPTEEFELEGKTYAGKIPTNSVGFMEVLGHEEGVLNDDAPDGDKGLFTKGTGRGYARYCEWAGLAQPESPEDRIPINISKDGTVSVRK